jgi:hypothetical protein
MNALGRHILAEIYGCDADVLNDRANYIEKDLWWTRLWLREPRLGKWHFINSALRG